MADANPNHLDDEQQPNVGTDPMDQPQDGTKRVVAPDPKKVAEAERQKAADRAHETPEEEAERIKNA